MQTIPVKPLHNDEKKRACYDLRSVLDDQVRNRAFELFCMRGHAPGNEHDNWCRAEREILGASDAGILEIANGYRIRLNLPGFTVDQIRVRAAPARVVVEAEKHEDAGTMAIRNVYRRLLPQKRIDVGGTSATFGDGTLEVNVPVAQVRLGNGKPGQQAAQTAAAAA